MEVNTLSAFENVQTTEFTNTTSAENNVMATDYAAATSNLSKFEILEQTGISTLAQANSTRSWLPSCCSKVPSSSGELRLPAFLSWRGHARLFPGAHS